MSTVSIADAGLLRALRYNLGLRADTGREVPVAELEQLVDLSWSGDGIGEHDPKLWKRIQSLAGLEHCTRLKVMGLGENSVTSLAPITRLEALEQLWLAWNSIFDLSPLRGKHRLRTLDLRRNPVQDISPLAGLEQLDYLSLDETRVQDLSPLLQLPRLSRLSLHGVNFPDDSPSWDVLTALEARGVQLQLSAELQTRFHAIRDARKLAQRGPAPQGDALAALLEEHKLPTLLRLWLDRGKAGHDEKGNNLLHLVAAIPPKDLAESVRRELITRMLAAGVDPREQNASGETPLTVFLDAHIGTDFAGVESLLEANVDLDTPREKPPLARVLRIVSWRAGEKAEKLRALARKLIERGADITTPAAFHALCSTGPIEAVEEAIRRGADLGSRLDGRIPLMRATAANRLDVMRLLLDRGAAVNGRDEYQRTAVHDVQTVAALELLLERGADARATDRFGHTALSPLVRWASNSEAQTEAALTLMERFIQLGLDPNEPRHEKAPLHELVYQPSGESVPRGIRLIDALIAHGANVNALDKEGRSPFDCAIAPDVRKHVQKLKGKQGSTVLKNLVKEASAEKISLGSKGWKALVTLVERAQLRPLDVSVPQRLMDTLIIPELTKRGDEVSMALAPMRLLHVSVLWLEHGSRALDELLRTATHLDVLRWKELADAPKLRDALVQALVRAGADVSAVDNIGHTPLSEYLSSHGRDLTTFRMLVRGGIVDVPANEPPLSMLASALDTAPAEEARVLNTMLDELVAQGSKLTDSIIFTALCRTGRVELVRRALEQGADVNAAGRHGYSPLAEATYGDRLVVMEVLLEAGADVHGSGGYEAAPARKVQSAAAVDLLLSRGADFRETNEYGDTVFHSIARGIWGPKERMIGLLERLLALGLDLEAKTNSGVSPRDVLLYGRKEELGEFLSSIPLKGP
jgi:ankyrin repeat protein